MKRFGFWPIVAFIVLAVPLLMMGFNPPPAGNTGAPNDGTCASCHNGVSSGGSVLATFPSTNYTPGGAAQNVTVTMSDTTHTVWAFEMTARSSNPANGQAGSFTAGANTQVVTSGAIQDIENTAAGSNQKVWNFTWTPPATNVGNVTFYLIGLAASSSAPTGPGNGIFTAQSVLTPAPAANPDFTLSASPSTVAITQGTSQTSTITVNPVNGFTGNVTFPTLSGLPSGVTAAFSPNPTTSKSTLTFTASSTAAATTSPVNVTITGTSPGPSGTTLSHTATVALTVLSSVSASISATPSALSFAYQIGGTAPATQNISVATTGTVTYSVATATTSGGAWLSATPTSGSSSGPVTVSVNPTGLSAGTYNGTVTITAPGATGSPKSVPVTLTVTQASAATISATPLTLPFAYQIGGTAPASKPITVTTTGTVNYSVASTTTTGGNWLSATPTSGSSSGTVAVSVTPTGLSAGTYNGTVTITASGATGSPQIVQVTLTVTQAGTSPLTVTPMVLNFNTSGGGSGDDASEGGGLRQRLTITSPTGASVSYTDKETTGGSWLMLGSLTGITPGTLIVSVNPQGLASGIYHATITITPSGATAGPQLAVPVTLTVGTPTTSSLFVTPRHLTFSFSGTNEPESKTVHVTSGSGSLQFTAAASGGSWLSVNPMNATTPATLSVSVDARGLSTGTYSGMITLTAGTRKRSVYVTVYVVAGVGGGGDDSGGEVESQLAIQPVVNDPTNSGTVGAALLDAAGVPVTSQTASSSGNLALALSKTAHAPAGTSAGAQLVGAENLTKLTELGFDVRQGGHCTATSPHFVVVTSDDVTHVLTGCANGTIQTAPAQGWIRVRFDPANPAQASPPIAPGQQIKSIAIVLDEGPEATPNPGGGLAVLDNIDVNGVIVGKD